MNGKSSVLRTPEETVRTPLKCLTARVASPQLRVGRDAQALTGIQSDLHHFLVPRQAEISCLLKKNANSCGVRFPSDPCGLTAL